MTDETPKKAIRSKRKPAPKTLEIRAETKDLTSWRCRKCLVLRPLKDYYQATDPIDIEGTGHMSVCRHCIEDMYEKYYVSEKSLEKAIFRICKLLNVKYDDAAIETTKKASNTLKEKGKPVTAVFGIYRRSLLTSGFGGFRSEGDMSFQGFVDFTPSKELEETLESEEDIEYFKRSWGEGLELADYRFLEDAYARWTETAPAANYGIEILLRELCHKENEIRKTRLRGESTDNLVKNLQEIMKNSALTPALQRESANKKSAEAFGSWIKDIENSTPAEWYLDQEKFKDLQGMDDYFDRFVRRSIKNFITGSREFNVEEDLGLDSDIDDVED